MVKTVDYTKKKTREGMGLHPIVKCASCKRNGLFIDGWTVHEMETGDKGKVLNFCGWVRVFKEDGTKDSDYHIGETNGKSFIPLYPGYGLRSKPRKGFAAMRGT